VTLVSGFSERLGDPPGQGSEIGIEWKPGIDTLPNFSSQKKLDGSEGREKAA